MTSLQTSTPRYGMVVDINRCVGCQTCTISCKHVNDTPPGVQWRRVLDVERGEFPDVERMFLVVGCQHCAEPPCVPVCPTGATRQREDGLVTMDYDQCIGCGYCAVACPYQARTIVHEENWYYGEPTQQETTVRHDERMGVANKCTFCVEKIDDAARIGKTPGVDLEFTPACAASCITQAIKFGDFNDPHSEVSQLVASEAHFQMHEELGTDPQIKYLYEVPSSTPGLDATSEDLSDEKLSDPENPLVGKLQTFWDLRAAANFTLGGMSAGLGVIAAILYGLGVIPVDGARIALVVSAIGMAIGLFAVFLEIGKKARFLFVLLRPQTSWMTRETYAVAVFYPSVLLAWFAPSTLWIALSGFSAAAFLFCQARILYAAKGIPAWRAPATPWLIGATGLLEGTGLLAVLLGLDHNAFGAAAGLVWVSFLGVMFAVLGIVVWCYFIQSARNAGLPPLARSSLGALDPWLRWGGYIAPAAAFAAAWALSGLGGWTSAALCLGGATAVLFGAVMKVGLVTRAGFQQGYAIPRMPQRGSGARAAPVRLDVSAVRVNG